MYLSIHTNCIFSYNTTRIYLLQHFPSQGSQQRHFAFRSLILKNLKPSVIFIINFHKALLTLTLEEEHGG